jgi:hypothetical protein
MTARACSCARNTDGSVTTTLCPRHAATDPCLTMSTVTGRRRTGTIRRGVCTSCGHGAEVTAPTYAERVHHGMLTYPTPENPGTDAWEQLGPAMTDGLTEFYGVRGMDGREYVAEGAAPGAWRIVRRGSYGLGAVVRSDSVKGAVQRLNAFHTAEICDHCGHVNSERGHGCEQCGRIRYALRYA